MPQKTRKKSQGLKPITITDLPVHIFNDIVKPLGDNCRFDLRKVCNSFRNTVDTWDPKYEAVHVGTTDRNVLCIGFGYYRVKYGTRPGNRCRVTEWNTNKLNAYEVDGDYMDVAIDDLYSILKNPKLKLTHFSTGKYGSRADVFETFMNKLALKLRTMDIKINCERIRLEFQNPKQEIQILKSFQPGTLKKIEIGRYEKSGTQVDAEKMMEELMEMEQIKKAESIKVDPNLLGIDDLFSIPRLLKCPKIKLYYRRMSGKKAAQAVKSLLNSPILKSAEVKKTTRGWATLRKELHRIGANSVPGRLDLLTYPIPGSEEFFEIDLSNLGLVNPDTGIRYNACGISIDRKQKL